MSTAEVETSSSFVAAVLRVEAAPVRGSGPDVVGMTVTVEV